MNHYCYTWVKNWCEENGWTDLFIRERNEYWAFPPNGVMPLPVPAQALRVIKQEQGLTVDEKWWCLTAVLSALAAGTFSYFSQSPMPLVAAFAFCAITVARLEVED